jgi:hypothetical protein
MGSRCYAATVGWTKSIGNAVQRGNVVDIFDEKGNQTGQVFAGNGPADGLKAYTSSTVNVRFGVIYSYDHSGQQISQTSAV